MIASEAVREVMKEQGVGVTRVANRLNKSPRLVSERLRQESLTTPKLNELLRALDYKIVVIPKGSRVPDGGYEIE